MKRFFICLNLFLVDFYLKHIYSLYIERRDAPLVNNKDGDKKMINLEYNTAIKKLGAKWDGKSWVAPKMVEKEAAELYNKYFGDLVTIDITLRNSDCHGGRLGYSDVLGICGYVIATASGRDSGARICDGIAILDGRVGSGGSIKNYSCDIKSDTLRIRLQVGRAMLSEFEAIENADLKIVDSSTPSFAQIEAAKNLLVSLGYTIQAPISQ